MKTPLVISLFTLMLFSSQSNAEDNFHYDYATVMQSTPVYRIVEVVGEEQKCAAEIVYQPSRPVSKTSSIVGGILGAAIGHAIGHKSKHRRGATIAGAIVGSSIAGVNDRNSKQSRLENRCKMAPTSWEEERIIGYNVVYRYNGRTFETRLPFAPSDSLKIRVRISPIAESEG